MKILWTCWISIKKRTYIQITNPEVDENLEIIKKNKKIKIDEKKQQVLLLKKNPFEYLKSNSDENCHFKIERLPYEITITKISINKYNTQLIENIIINHDGVSRSKKMNSKKKIKTNKFMSYEQFKKEQFSWKEFGDTLESYLDSRICFHKNEMDKINKKMVSFNKIKNNLIK